MTKRGIGFIGGGRITRILLAGLKRANRLPERIIVSDTDMAVLERLQKEFPTITILKDANGRAAAQNLVFLALHPPALGTGLADLKSNLKSDAVVVSLAPKWTMAKLSQALGGFARLARAIPNAPSIVNHGYNPLCFSDGISAAERRDILDLFAVWGAAPEVPEDTLEAYAIVAAMGPTYLWYQLFQLADLGKSFGLAPAATNAAIAAMVDGAVRTMVDADLSPAEVMDLVPVKPLSAIEPMVRDAYATTLSDLYRKLKQ
jgi:pyrroline-5-carboxylate reductase